MSQLSGNIDEPEASMDALMQAIVCSVMFLTINTIKLIITCIYTLTLFTSINLQCHITYIIHFYNDTVLKQVNSYNILHDI